MEAFAGWKLFLFDIVPKSLLKSKNGGFFQTKIQRPNFDLLLSFLAEVFIFRRELSVSGSLTGFAGAFNER